MYSSGLRGVFVALLFSCLAIGQEPTFKAETNVVLVPVVVRGRDGNAVGNLHKEDFQLFDKGKAQAITQFSVEQIGAKVAEDRSVAAVAGESKAAPAVIPEHYVALVFDDLHVWLGPNDPPPGWMSPGDVIYLHKAGWKYVNSLSPGDRIAIYTTSGQLVVDYTSDRAKLQQVLGRPNVGQPKLPTIDDMPSALRGPGSPTPSADRLESERQARALLHLLQAVIGRMDHLPGQRTLVLMSPGMALRADPFYDLTPDTMELINRAIRSRVVVESLDARGLYPAGDYPMQEFMARMADGTGGRFITDTNDMDGAVHKLAATPKYIYVLGFSPASLRREGRFHELRVKLRDGHGLQLEARKGYWEPNAKAGSGEAPSAGRGPAPHTPQVSETETKQIAQAIGAEGAKFKAETNVVLVPVVVRDKDGKAVANLTRDDFQLSDNGKPREINGFTVERSGTRVARERSVTTAREKSGAAEMVIPDHFIVYVFEDRTFARPDILAWVRDAAMRHMATLQPGDRVAVITGTCTVNLDFTDDRAKLEAAISKLQYKAHSICNDPPRTERIDPLLRAIRRLSFLPGQRSIVYVSGDLSVDPYYLQQVTDLAVHSQVVINTLNSGGLPDGAPSEPASPQSTAEQMAANQGNLGVSALAYGTGGTLVENTNDADSAYRRLATPDWVYVLSFTPEEDADKRAFHHLKVGLKDRRGFTLQARRGYYTGTQPEVEAAETVGAPAAGRVASQPPQVSAAESNEIASAIGAAEISTTNEPVSFRAQTNLVEVPVVVRDREGHAVGNLRREDFHLSDKGAKQEIAKFRVETSSGVAATSAESKSPSAGAPGPANLPASTPDHYIAFLFDDLHIQTADLPQVRDAVRKYIASSLQPGDRAALYTTSGRVTVDFTTDAGALDAALLKIRPSPLTSSSLRYCMYISYFQAVQVEQQVSLHPTADDVSRSSALKAAVFDVGRCLKTPDAFNIAVREINDSFMNGKQETRAALAALRAVVRHMAALPGKRTIILASPGFFVSPELQDQSSDLISQAIRANVLVNSISARGVWTSPVYDVDQKGAAPPPDVITFKNMEGGVNDDELIALAEGTGGTANFNNDFAGGVRKAAAAPEYMYVLAFEPKDLKFDGSFHALKVTVSSRDKLSLLARRGYWAPKQAQDASGAAKKEIEDAVFSRDEIHDLPVDMHTQVVKAATGEKLSVLTTVDLKLMHFRKADDRNRNDVTIVATLFDPNGNFIAGTQKVLQLRLRDQTVQALAQRPPVTISTDFDVKPGGYLVRLVARDAEGQQLTTENAAVQVQ